MTQQTQSAVFGNGCFWCTEAVFDELRGVLSVMPGYAGGQTKNPTYEQVCTGATGHAESVRVIFDPEQVTYEALVRKFFTFHNPTELNRQGPDVGSQYRSAIFYLTPEQKEVAEKVAAELAPGYLPRTIVTEIVPASTFYRAEEYHQRYFEKHPEAVCHI